MDINGIISNVLTAVENVETAEIDLCHVKALSENAARDFCRDAKITPEQLYQLNGIINPVVMVGKKPTTKTGKPYAPAEHAVKWNYEWDGTARIHTVRPLVDGVSVDWDGAVVDNGTDELSTVRNALLAEFPVTLSGGQICGLENTLRKNR